MMNPRRSLVVFMSGLMAMSVLSILFLPASDAALRAEPSEPDVIWKSEIGTGGGGPFVSKGMLFVGTDNRGGPKHTGRDPQIKGYHGVMMCFDSDKGAFLGQFCHRQLKERIHDMNGRIMGVPCVDETHVYYYSNRGELVCAMLSTIYNNNDRKDGIDLGRPEAKAVVWSVDLPARYKVFKRDAADVANPLPSPILYENLVICATGNGTTYASGENLPFIPAPDAPSLVALDKDSGKLVWSTSVGMAGCAHAQWGTPTINTDVEPAQVVFPGGDGVIYGLNARTGKWIWEVDCNDPKATRWGPEFRGTQMFFSTRILIRDNIAFIGMTTEYEGNNIVPRPIIAVDTRREGKFKRDALKWSFMDKDFGATSSAIVAGKGGLYTISFSGHLVCLDAEKGTVLWRDNLKDMAPKFASVCVHEGIVYVPIGDKLYRYVDGNQKKLLGCIEFEEGEIVGTPYAVKGRLYVATTGMLYCVRTPK